jgi:hypothetical protein
MAFLLKKDKFHVVAYKSDYGKTEVVVLYVFFVLMIIVFLPLLNISISAFIGASLVICVLF